MSEAQMSDAPSTRKTIFHKLCGPTAQKDLVRHLRKLAQATTKEIQWHPDTESGLAFKLHPPLKTKLECCAAYASQQNVAYAWNEGTIETATVFMRQVELRVPRARQLMTFVGMCVPIHGEDGEVQCYAHAKGNPPHCLSFQHLGGYPSETELRRHVPTAATKWVVTRTLSEEMVNKDADTVHVISFPRDLERAVWEHAVAADKEDALAPDEEALSAGEALSADEDM
ncbi:MAG: hypothetical protein MHM6MM_008476 [Cercozoa sp. M6MM]